MEVTVKKALTIGGLKKAKIIAGEEGLNNIIKYVSVIEVPDISQWFRGYELWISALYTLKEDIQGQMKVLDLMAEYKSAGLVICYCDTYIKNISSKLIKKANHLKIPLMLIPEEVAYVDIISPILSEILNQKTTELEYTVAVHERFAKLLFNRKINDYNQDDSFKLSTKVINELFNLIKRPIVLADQHNKILAYSPNYQQMFNQQKINPLNLLNNLELRRLKNNNKIIIIHRQYSKIVFKPIVFGNNYYGTTAVLMADNLSKLEEIAVEQAITVFAIILMNKISIKKYINRKKQGFFNDLLKGKFKSNTSMEIAAQEFDWNISNIKIAIFLKFQTTQKNYNLPELIKQKVNERIKADNPNHISIFEHMNLSIFLESEQDYSLLKEKAKNLIESIDKIIKEIDNRIEYTAGIGDYAKKPIDLRKSYEKAIKAKHIAEKLIGAGSIINIEDINMLYLLDKLSNNQDVKNYVLNQIKKIKDYDLEKGTDLLQILEMLINDVQTQDIAEKMYIHRNTVNYRKKQIIKILEKNPFEEPYKTNYKITFTLYKLLN